MAVNRGKQFEDKFKEDFLKIPNSICTRLYDTTNGYFGIRNICDFICYVKPTIFYMECKSVHGNTFPYSKLTQLPRMLEVAYTEGVKAGVVIWFVEHDKIVYVPVISVKELMNKGDKSFNIRKPPDEVYYKNLPSTKKRVFLDTDYSVLI